jgi:hypothetical protein
MAKSNFSIQPLLDKGYVLDEKTGTLTPPKLESPYIKQQRAIQNEGLIVREKVNETPDFTAKINTEWFIRGGVVAKKNSRQNFVKNGRQISIPSKKHAEYKQMTAMQYQVFGIEFRRAVKFYGLEYPLRVEFTFVRGSQRRADFTNLCQSCEDLMVENQWIPDDDMLHIIPSFQPRQYDKNNSGVLIKLLVK